MMRMFCVGSFLVCRQMGDADGDNNNARSMLQTLIAQRDAAYEARFRELEAGQATLRADQAEMRADLAALRKEVARLDAEIAEIRANTADQIQREIRGVWCSLDVLLESMLPNSACSNHGTHQQLQLDPHAGVKDVLGGV